MRIQSLASLTCTLIGSSFLSFTPLIAQRQDVRISPEDPVIHVLPTSARIQSTARLGDRTLVVWGTTSNRGDSIVNVLAMQMLRGASTLDSQRSLASSEARPYGFVQVIPLASSFLVVWNDSREGSAGIYTRKVAIDGSPVGQERWISSGIIHPDSTGRIMLMGDPARGQLLLWNDDRTDAPGLYAMRIDGAGEIDGNERRLGASVRTLLTFNTLPDATLLDVASGGIYFVDGSGRIDSRTINSAMLSTPYHLGSDTSLVRLVADTLQFFTSIFDQQPSRQIHLPTVDNTMLLARDSLGNVHLYNTTVQIFGSQYSGTTTIIDNYDLEVTPDDSVHAPRNVYHSESGGPTSPNWLVAEFLGTSRSFGCSNTERLTLQWKWTQYVHGNPQPPQTGSSYATVDVNGNFRYGGDSGYLSNCIVQPALLVQRIADSNLSSVRITVDNQTVMLQATIAPQQIQYPRESPTVMFQGEDLLTTWYDPNAQTRYVLARWDAALGSNVTIMDRYAVPEMSGPSYSMNGQLQQRYTSGYDRHIVFPGAFAILYSHQMQDYVLWHYTQASYANLILYSSQNFLVRPGRTKWASIFTMVDYPSSYQMPGSSYFQSWHEAIGAFYDPNRDEVLVILKTASNYNAASKFSLHACGNEPGSGWALDSITPVPDNAILLPVNSLQYLCIAGNDAIWFRGTDTVAHFTFPSAPAPAYQRMRGSYLLRRYWIDTTRSEMQLERWSLRGELLASQRIQLPDHNDVMAIENPNDSMMVLLSGGERGVRATVLDKMLNVQVADTQVSVTSDVVAAPSGIFRHDTLFTVWEDYRNGPASIYGTAMAFARTSADTPSQMPRDVTPTGMSVTPNPANDAVTINLALPKQSDLEIEIWNMLGQKLTTKQITAAPSGQHRYTLSLDAIHDGIYFIRCIGGEFIGTSELVIAR